MTDAETLAVAVLKGDYAAAAMLNDYLQEHVVKDGSTEIPPITKLDCDPEQIRLLMHIDYKRMREVHGEGYDFDQAGTQAAIRRWASGGGTLGLGDYVRVSIYQFPKEDQIPQPPLSVDAYLRAVLNYTEQDVAVFLQEVVSKLPAKEVVDNSEDDSDDDDSDVEDL
jgi:hypothetical protein